MKKIILFLLVVLAAGTGLTLLDSRHRDEQIEQALVEAENTLTP